MTANTQDQLPWNSAGGALVGNEYGDFLNQLKQAGPAGCGIVLNAGWARGQHLPRWAT